MKVNLVLLKTMLFVSSILSIMTILFGFHGVEPLLLLQAMNYLLVLGTLYGLAIQKHKAAYLLIPFFFGPLFFSQKPIFVITILAISSILAYGLPALEHATFKDVRYLVKNFFIVLGMSVVIKLFMFFLGMSWEHIAPFLTLSVLSLVTLLRLLRRREANLLKASLFYTNFKTFVFSILSIVLVNLKQTVEALLWIAGLFARMLPQKTALALHKWINGVFDSAAKWLFDEKSLKAFEDFLQGYGYGPGVQETEESVKEALEKTEEAFNSETLPIIQWLFFLIIIVVVISILSAIFIKIKKRTPMPNLDDDFKMEREFIKEDTKKPLSSIFKIERKPKTALEKLRWSYRRYLKALQAEVDVSAYNTCTEIEILAKETELDKQVSGSEVRALYTEGRYGTEVNESSADQLMAITKKL